MDGKTFDALTRRAAAAVSRRGSLVAIGAAALGAATLAPARVAAKKKKCKQKCQKQVQQCDDEVQQFCSRFIAERAERCRQNFLPCCAALGSCNAAGSTECFLDRTIFVCNP